MTRRSLEDRIIEAEHDAVRDALSALVKDRGSLVERAVAHLSAFAPDEVAKMTPAAEAAAEWLRKVASIDSDALEKVLEGIHAAGAEVGANLAADAIPGGSMPEGASVVTDWSTWVPGDARAAGYADLLGVRLDALDITIQGITDTTLDALGITIGDGVAAGDSMETIAGAVDAYFDDPARSMMIARTETCRAVSAASEATYADNGVASWTWEVGEGCCDECEVLDGDEYDVDGPMDPPPLHPNCRCTASPVVSTGAGESEADEG